jgi:hypothetical protein
MYVLDIEMGSMYVQGCRYLLWHVFLPPNYRIRLSVVNLPMPAATLFA